MGGGGGDDVGGDDVGGEGGGSGGGTSSHRQRYAQDDAEQAVQETCEKDMTTPTDPKDVEAALNIRQARARPGARGKAMKCPKCGGVNGWWIKARAFGHATEQGGWGNHLGELVDSTFVNYAKTKTVLCIDCKRRVPRPAQPAEGGANGK